MYDQVKAYIIENEMIRPGDAVIAGVSGGGDSMAMLHILNRLRKTLDFRLTVVHVNHGIRGPEADRDQALVEEACKSAQLPFRVYAYDVPALAAHWKLGTEETGRKVRREAFESEREKVRREAFVTELEMVRWDQIREHGKVTCEMTGKGQGNVWGETHDDGREQPSAAAPQVQIALAHNQDDLAETMLHHLARGTGIRGLCSMRPVSGAIIRPVLCLGRAEIGHYLKENAVPHALDITNLSDEYTRNRIRHHIMPLMEQEINVCAAAHMAETSRVLAEAEDYLSRQGRLLLERFQEEDGEYLLGPAFWQEEPVLRAYAIGQAFEELAGRRQDFTSLHVRQVTELADRQTGREIALPYGLCAQKTYQGVRLGTREASKARIGPQETARQEWEIPLPGTLTCPLGTFEAEIFSYEGQKIQEKKCTKWFDYDKIECNLCARTRRTGDFLTVNSEGGRKKLNRCMIDEKIPRELRERIPLVAAGQEVLWMVGGRMNERYKITPQTRRVLELRYQGGSKDE